METAKDQENLRFGGRMVDVSLGLVGGDKVIQNGMQQN